MTITTQNDFAGAVLALTDTSRASEIADYVASNYFPESEYHFTVTDATPTNLPVGLRDQMAAHQRDLDVPSHILTVYPWALDSK